MGKNELLTSLEVRFLCDSIQGLVNQIILTDNSHEIYIKFLYAVEYLSRLAFDSRAKLLVGDEQVIKWCEKENENGTTRY